MDFKDLTVENINDNELCDDKLVNMLFKSIREMVEVDFIKDTDHEMAKKITAPTFDHIKTGISFEHKEVIDKKKLEKEQPSGQDVDEIPLKKVYEIKVPVYDEQKRDRYQKRPKRLPETGKFVQSEANAVIKPLGLLELLIWGAQLSRMEKDTRNLSPKYTFKVTDYAYYNYDEEEYRMVMEDVLEKANFELKNGKKLEELEIDEHVRIYLGRQLILDKAEERLKGYAEFFQDQFEDRFKDDAYNVKWNVNEEIDEMALNSIGHPIIIIPLLSDIKAYKKRYLKFIRNYLPKWLKIKLAFSSISLREYEEEIKEIVRLRNILLKLGKDIDDLEIVLIKNGKEPQQISWVQIDDDKNFDEGSIKSRCMEYFTDLKKFTESRPEQAMDISEPKKGYIKCDINNWEAFPNIAEIERRRSLTELYGRAKEQDYIDNLLQYLKRKQSEKQE